MYPNRVLIIYIFSSIIRDHQIACCLWGRYAEQLLYTYKVGRVNKNFLCLLRFAKINVYKGKISTKLLISIYFDYDFNSFQYFTLFVVGQFQITNAFDTSTLEINPPGFDVQDYIRLYVILSYYNTLKKYLHRLHLV